VRRLDWRWMTLGLALAALPVAADESFSLEEILSIPYPTQIATAASADRVVWISNRAGVRNIWTAAGPDLSPARITDYVEDDGQTLGGLAVSADGRVAVFVRGGGENRAGETPNPTSDPAGASQSIWAVSTSGGDPWRVGDGAAPVISPDGSQVVFREDGVLHLAPLGSGPADGETDSKPLFQARGGSRGAAWSPQGDRLAFVSDRGDHSFIGIFDLEAERILWVAPSVDRDDHLAWSADGSQLAFVRRNGALKGEIFNFLISWSFRLMVADAATGEASEIWRSPESGGGFAQIYPAHPLRWAGIDRLVFYSEHSGWMHIYSISTAGGEPVDLTPGQCEAEDSAVDPAGRWMAFSHNCDEIDRRQVSRVEVGGGSVERLTADGGIYSSPAFADSGRRLFLRAADATRATVVAAVGPAGVRPVSALDTLIEEHLVEPRQMVFEAGDGVEVHGQLFLPKSVAGDGKHPAILFMHGGPMRQMLLGWHYREYYSRCYAFNQYLASRGWVVLSVNYRAGIGYGQGFRLAERQGPYGASEYQDIVAAARLLQQRPEVDAERVALWGGSYGGYLTALGLARNSSLFAAGVDLHGVHDWSFRATDFTEGGGWGIEGEAAMKMALESSPAVDVSNWTSPVLLVHGDDDRNVLFQQTTDLVQRLRGRGLEPELLVLPDEVHGFLRHESWLRVFTAATDFLDRSVGSGASRSP
jgi:dipeptidyl aminopeptidase/acylaminoacyl peptidase